jgi:2-polyprenyl-3-methyl-5-hydroxy-6-metoxy-1,4-benzoquinol methylase
MEPSKIVDEELTFRCLCSESDDYKLLFSVGTKAVCQCNSCAQVYVRGIDRSAAETEYDESSYFTERNSYLKNQEAIASQFQKILDRVKLYKAGGMFLDVGCSVGIFLDVVRRNGFEAKGVEVSKWASEFSRQKGFDVVTGGLVDGNYPEKSFDIVIMNHVLEHISEPIKILVEVKRILKDDGLFVIGVPNFGSYMAKLLKGKWFSLMPDQHIWQFTHESLCNLLKRTGFTEVYFEAKDNHKIIGWRPVKVGKRLINVVAVMTNNAEAMMVFARKAMHE